MTGKSDVSIYGAMGGAIAFLYSLVWDLDQKLHEIKEDILELYIERRLVDFEYEVQILVCHNYGLCG